MLVKDVMSPELDTIASDAPLAEAIGKLSHDGGALAVFDGQTFKGTLSEYDIVLWQAEPEHDLKAAQVRDVLRQHPFLSEDQDVRLATKLMKDEHAGGLLVAKGQQPIGTVTLVDVAAKAASQVPSTDGGFPATISLQPIAAPSILGFFGLAAAACVVGAQMAGWYGNVTTPLYIFSFAALMGGLAQFTAGLWAYRARDSVATAVHGIWGGFWLAYGLLYLLVANHTLALVSVNQTYGFWFIPLAAISLIAMIAAFAENGAFGVVMAALTATSLCGAISLLVGDANWIKVTGWLFVFSALTAWYLASALLLEGAYRRVLLPLGRIGRGPNVPGSTAIRPAEYPLGEPGVRAGQ